MSDRKDIAERIAAFIVEKNLAQVFGGDVSQDPSKRSYNVGMSICRYMDGCVKVFGPTFILVSSSGPSGDGQRVYGTEADALAYIEARWVRYNREEADNIPQRPTKGR